MYYSDLFYQNSMKQAFYKLNSDAETQSDFNSWLRKKPIDIGSYLSANRVFIKLLFIFIFLFIIPEKSHAQENPGITTRAVVYQGDTIPYIELPTFRFFAPRIFTSNREERQYQRLVRNVKRVYPYARLAGIKFDEYSKMLDELETDAQRRRATRQIEREIRDEFEGELRRLTISQGHILIKLIDRETNHTSYDVLRDFRGAFTAVFWQSFGRIFGYNLKTEYDPYGEDILIEEIVQLIEMGAI
ncbi:MAG: DUF4294 domain-containing protein [Bacteroidetes bacterium]|nr:MAG: DUF4294 domain-containing protein [Bacteroidota bacterium]